MVLLLAIKNTFIIGFFSALVTMSIAWVVGTKLQRHLNQFMINILIVLTFFTYWAPITLPISTLAQTSMFTYSKCNIVLVHLWYLLPYAICLRLQYDFRAERYYRKKIAQNYRNTVICFYYSREFKTFRAYFFIFFTLAVGSFLPILMLGQGPQDATLTVLLYQELLEGSLNINFFKVLICLVIILCILLKGIRQADTGNFGTADRMPGHCGSYSRYSLIFPGTILLVLGVWCIVPYIDLLYHLSAGVRLIPEVLRHLGFTLVISMITALIILGSIVATVLLRFDAYRAVNKVLHNIAILLKSCPKMAYISITATLFSVFATRDFFSQVCIYFLAGFLVFFPQASLLWVSHFSHTGIRKMLHIFILDKRIFSRMRIFSTEFRLRMIVIICMLILSQVTSSSIPVFLQLDQLPHIGSYAFHALINFQFDTVYQIITIQCASIAIVLLILFSLKGKGGTCFM